MTVLIKDVNIPEWCAECFAYHYDSDVCKITGFKCNNDDHTTPEKDIKEYQRSICPLIEYKGGE